MAAERVSSPKPSKWFSNKGLKLSFSPRLSKSCSSFSPPSSPISPSARKVDKREDELKEIFRYFDGDGDGKISASELRNYFGSIGEYMSHEEAQGVIDDLDTDGDNLLDFRDFFGLMKRNKNGDDDLKMAFEMFEHEKGSGCITPKGLQTMLNRLGDSKSLDECVTMIQVYDKDGNGVLDFQEFHQMMA